MPKHITQGQRAKQSACASSWEEGMLSALWEASMPSAFGQGRQKEGKDG